MILSKQFETLVKGLFKTEFHQLEIQSINVSCREDARELNYNDFICNFYIDRKLVGEISKVLSKTPAWTEMIDSVDWELEFVENKIEENEHRRDVFTEMGELFKPKY